jgi:serine/threonine protein kinase
MAGETFGNYEVVATLGKGGMGVVFLGEHQRIARSAAIKVLAPELTTNPDVLRRFFTEARATSLIRHPGIVEVFDCDVDAAGRAYIVMEYLQGETLAACLARVDALPWRMACAIAKRIAGAVGAAHERGIIHRDLKPENVFLSNDRAAAASPDAAVKILDFGIAKLLSSDTPNESLTRTGMVLGTPRYIAPEQCGGVTAVDHRADVYSLGCILFEMLCGRPPFEHDGFRALLVAHMFQPPPLASTLAPEIPPWLDDLIARMLAKQPDCRPASMAEVADRLSEGLSQRLSEGDHTGEHRSRWVPPAGRQTCLLPVVRPAARRTADFRRRGVAVAGLVGGLAAAVAISVLVLSHAPRKTNGSAEAAEAAAVAQAADATGATALSQTPAAPAIAIAVAPAPSPARTEQPPPPVPPRAPSKPRVSETPARPHAESRRAAALPETDGIVDL